MSNSTPLTPTKLKDQLTSLRESITSLSASITGYAILLIIELASRDIHYAIPTDLDDADIISLLEAVNTTAGKPAIAKDAYPAQLMAALYAAGGMAASALSSCTKSNRSNSVREACSKTMKRCSDVDDGKFYTLLKLLSSDLSHDDNTLITDIAYANYLYGAEKYGVDQMPMWKRCLDCAISTSGESGENHQSYMNAKAIVPLKNMIRIAQSKGNTKRVEELRVWLVCGYIGAIQSRLNNGDGDRKEETVFDKMPLHQLVDVFFLRKTSLVKLDRESLECLLELAGECLSACPAPMNTASDESKLLYFYLQTQIHHLSEEAKIFEEVQQLIRAKKNRLPENEAKSGKSGKLSTDAVKSSAAVNITMADKAEMYNQTRQKLLLDAWSQWYNAQEKELVPLGLRDSINHCEASGPLLNDCLRMVKLQIEQLFDTAIALQQRRNEKKGKLNLTSEGLLSCWNQVLSFVSPLLMGYLSAVISKHSDTTGSIKDSIIENPLETLIGSVSQSIVSAAWMCDPLMSKCTATMHETTFQKVPQLLSTAHQCLMLLQRSSRRNQLSEESAQKKADKAFSSDDGSDLAKMELLLLDYSLASTEVRMDLTTALGADSGISTNSLSSIAHKSTLAAVASTKSGVELKASSKFGTSFLQFTSAWSGLYMNPWPFCNLGQGRTILRNARDSLVQAAKVWGREVGSNLEDIVLGIGEADLEGGITGGFVQRAKQLYEESLGALESLDVGDGGVKLLRAHCLVGLSRISSMNDVDSERYARAALDTLSAIESEGARSSRCALICVYPWDERLLSIFARSYHESLSRQLVAEQLIRSTRLDEAHSFLRDAVESAPFNFDASFALGAFHLRKFMFSNRDSHDFDTLKKEAKTVLLKSAKMSTASPLPFALLGTLYEQDDIARAVGCFKKALLLDPSDPVAGRGLKRLLPLEDMRQFCDASVKQHSAYNGWAWRIVGQLRLSQGNYDSAVICFQQALRCRDMQDPDREVLGLFYTGLKVDNESYCESAEIWCELASCYRHMGKWSGSHRAYDSAYAVSKKNMSPNSLVDWAQVELELGLYDESIDRCNEAISSCANTQLKRLASYIKGKAIISMARQNLQDGKYGLAYGYIKLGASMRCDSYSELKLLGDLYSVGEALPSYVFVEDVSEFSNECAPDDDDEYEEYIITVEIKRKLRLLQAAKVAYSKALEMVRSENTIEEEKNLTAAAATDIGCILLAQARIISLALGDGSGGETSSISGLKDQHGHLLNIIEESIKSFMFAVENNPVDSSAWCGLGCAIVAIDPLKAQHSFARALQLDKMGIPEAWTNIGVMFTHYDFRSIASEVLDSLTQVEDTPLMWICRGLLFESAANVWQKQGASLLKAADAYRAALQLFQHPSALLGLSLTCRRNDLSLMAVNDEIYSALACEASKNESLLSMSVYQSIAGNTNHLAHVDLFMKLEKALDRLVSNNDETGEDGLQVKSLVDMIHERKLVCIDDDHVRKKSKTMDCEIDFATVPLKKATITGSVPFKMINEAIDNVLTVDSMAMSRHNNTQTKQIAVEDARNAVYLNPENGELWLNFAKLLVQELCVNFGQCSPPTILSSAKAAASRAYNILYASAVHASMISPTTEGTSDRSENRVNSIVASADIVSESLSLVSWLGDLDSVEKKGETTLNPLASMQEAYMLDPTNNISAKALMLKC